MQRFNGNRFSLVLWRPRPCNQDPSLDQPSAEALVQSEETRVLSSGFSSLRELSPIRDDAPPLEASPLPEHQLESENPLPV
jgi:hypothetical protein